MSLHEAKLWSVVKAQYGYKLKVYTGLLISLVVVQLIAMLFSGAGVGSSSSSSGALRVEVKYFSGNLVLMFTLMWSFIISLMLAGRQSRSFDFTLVSNRQSSHLSNMLFIGTLNVLAGTTAMLAGAVFKLFVYFKYEDDQIINSVISLQAFISGMIAMVAYTALCAAAGYFIGTLIQWQRAFIVLLPAVLFGFLTLGIRAGADGGWLIKLVQFFAEEHSLSVLIAKVISLLILFYTASFWLTRRTEVQR